MIDRSVAEDLTVVLRDLIHDARCMTSSLGPAALPASIARLLAVLEGSGEHRLGRLAGLLGIDLSVASRQSAAALERGFVERRPDPDDGRAWLLHLTPAGEEALAAHRAARAEWLRSVASSWSDGDARRLLADLQRLREDLRAARLAARPGDLQPA